MAWLSWPRKHKWLSVLMVIIILIIGYFAFAIIDQWIQKNHFKKARASIDLIYTDIVSQIGQPDDHQRESRCSRSQEEFGPGPLGCYMDTLLVYGVSDKTSSDQLMNKIRSVVNNSKSSFVAIPAPSELQGVITKAPGNTTISDYYRIKGKINCQSDYDFDTSFGSFLKLKNPNYKRLAVNISCSGTPNAYDFPFLSNTLNL